MEVAVPPAPAPAPRPRRGITLAEQLAASSNLRDLLKLRDDDDNDVEGGRRPATRRRTLLDAIRDAADDADDEATAGGAAPAAAPAPARERVSLMALLERTEHQWSGGGLWKRVGGEEDAAQAAPAEAEKGGAGAGAGAGVGGRCCVCVARGKGAAFIPCGHTFCRACARQLRAGRGRCPLCNAAIRDVLNLF